MLQWIANLIGRARRQANTEDSLPCVQAYADGNVRVEVVEYLLPCGHNAYGIKGRYFVEEYDEWVPIAELRDFNADTAVSLLQKAADFVALMEHGLVEERRPRQLPTLRLWGKRYFVDERLKELRNVENPHDRVQLHAVR
jgi:hypothetical protein